MYHSVFRCNKVRCAGLLWSHLRLPPSPWQRAPPRYSWLGRRPACCRSGAGCGSGACSSASRDRRRGRRRIPRHRHRGRLRDRHRGPHTHHATLLPDWEVFRQVGGEVGAGESPAHHPISEENGTSATKSIGSPELLQGRAPRGFARFPSCSPARGVCSRSLPAGPPRGRRRQRRRLSSPSLMDFSWVAAKAVRSTPTVKCYCVSL